MFVCIYQFCVFAESGAKINDSKSGEDYINDILDGKFTREDLEEYKSIMEGAIEKDELGLFLEARQALYDYDNQLAYDYLIMAYDLVKEKEDTLLKGEILYYIVEIELYFYDIAGATSKVLELDEIARNLGNKRLMSRASFDLAYIYIYNYQNEKAMQLADRGLAIADSINDLVGISMYYEFIASMDRYKGKYADAVDMYYKAYEKLPSIVNDYVIKNPKIYLRQVAAGENITKVNREEGLREVLSLIKEVDKNDYNTLYGLYWSLGNYHEKDDINASLDYYLKAYDNLKKGSVIYNKESMEQRVLINIGGNYYQLGQYQIAADYYNFALNLSSVSLHSEADIAEKIAQLEDYKFEEIYNKISLLEKLDDLNKEKLQLSSRIVGVLIICLIILFSAVFIVVFEIKEKNKTQKKLYKTSITDSLTQVFNREHILKLFESHLNKSNALLLMDLDDFKNVNDTYGHIVGDQVLVKVAEVMKASIRENDSIGRYGGEEFLVVFDNIDRKHLEIIAERIRQNIEKIEWSYKGLKTSASIGATMCFSDNLEEVLHMADCLMYQAKDSGKNRVICR